MNQGKAEIVFNQTVAPGYRRMGLACAPAFTDAVPGQFVMLRFPGWEAPLLRRPFSIHRLAGPDEGFSGIVILYKEVGQATALMAAARSGQVVDLLGPLGNGFRVDLSWRRVYMVAGGIGVAPLVLLAHALRANGIDLTQGRMFIGGRSREDLLCREDFQRLGLAVQVTTEDGSDGDQCLITHPLEAALEAQRADVVYACGPMAMLRCVVGIVEKHRVPCQLSVETVMACGLGACLGCALPTPKTGSRYLHACVDGPVFEAQNVVL